MTLPRDVGQWQGDPDPSQPQDHEDKQPIRLQSFCTHTIIQFFTFSTVFNKLHDILSTLILKGLC